MTATTRGSPIGGDDSQGHTPDEQSQPPFQQNQVGHQGFVTLGAKQCHTP